MPSSNATTQRCSHLYVHGVGMRGCKMQIPGAPISGQDESPDLGVLTSTVTEEDDLGVPDPTPQSP